LCYQKYSSLKYTVVSFLGAFAKSRKANISFVMSVCLSAWCNSVRTERIFVKFYIWISFENKTRKFKFHWNLTRITAHLRLWCYVVQFFLDEKCFRQICRVNQNTHLTFKFFFPENRAVCKIMWENIVESNTPHVTIWRKCIVCCITKATHTHIQNM